MNNNDRLNWVDRTLVVLSVMGSLFFSYLLLNSQDLISHFLPVQEGAKIIGFVEVANNDVRRRLKQSLLWYDVGSDEALYEKDAIFTGDNSETYIRLNGDVGFHMGANSMVVLSQENNEFKLDLQLGSVIADVKQGGELKLVGDGEEATIKGSQGANSQVSINKTKKGQIKLASLENAFELELLDGKKTIDAKKTLQLNSQLKEEANSQPVELIQPPLGHTIWHDPKRQFVFSWDILRKVNALTLQVAKDFDFKQVIYEQPAENKVHRASGVSKEGLYYWRIVEKSGSKNVKVVSEVHDFRVAIQTPPRMYIPKDKDILKSKFSEEGGPPIAEVQFLWEQKMGATRYQIQVAADAGFKKVLVNEELPDTFKNQVLLPRGDYFWRVRVTAPAQGVGFWAKPSKFSVGAPEEFKEILADLEQQRLRALELGQSSSGSPSYRKPDLALLGEKTTERNLPLRSPSVTKTKKTTLLQFDPGLSSREPAAVQKAITNPPTLEWEPVVGANGYDLEISSDKEFVTPVLRKRQRETTFTWEKAQVGQYFWRVRSHRGGDTASEYSPGHILNVGLESPVLEDHITRSFEAKSPKEFVSPGPPIGFEWKDLPMAEKYKVVVVREGDEKRVYDKIVEDPRAEVEFEKAGRYLAMVAALNNDGQRISPFSQPAQINFEKTFKFGTPQVLYPVNGTTVVTFGSGRPDSMILDWNRVDGAKSYRLQFSEDKKFRKVFLDKVIAKDQYFVNDVVPQGTIYWRVRAEYDTLTSNWTTPRYFEIQNIQNQ